jgi:hypothetical protein
MDTPRALGFGTLPAGGTLATPVGAGTPPFSLQLNSTNAGRAISVSMDGVVFFQQMPTSTVAGGILVEFPGPIGQVLFAGAAGDQYSIL